MMKTKRLLLLEVFCEYLKQPRLAILMHAEKNLTATKKQVSIHFQFPLHRAHFEFFI